MSLTEAAERKSDADLSALTAGYRQAVGSGHDEMMAPDGSIRPHYRPLIEALAALAPAAREARFRSARQYLDEAGVYHSVYGAADGSEEQREWPLSQPPLVLDPDEWFDLSAGLVQRANFLEALLGDLYGARLTIADGVLPSAILGQNPEFLRPLADQALVRAQGNGRDRGNNGRGSDGPQPLIRFIAMDLGRGPDGRWWVLGDRTQAPSGAGFALENRVASTKAFPDVSGAMNITRLAGFFRRFRDSLYGLAGPDSTRIGLLTPGPHNETYYEQAYLARYLGLLLLEGGDLVVNNGVAMVRTVDGAKPIEVLWRRLDADFCDPLELYAGSRIGTPGLVRAVLSGQLTMVNALGSGILESRALMAFQPALARALTGEALGVPTIATWWCGQSEERDYVLSHKDRLQLAAAFPPSATDLFLKNGGFDPRAFTDDPHANGAEYVGQEIAALSTQPVFIDGVLKPRPVTLRIFLCRDEAGWHAMPGGFARVGDLPDARVVSMQAGGRSTDVWIAARSVSKPVTLLGGGHDGRFLRRLPGALPARAADNLFWLGRYTERCEVATRLLRIAAAREAMAHVEPAPAATSTEPRAASQTGAANAGAHRNIAQATSGKRPSPNTEDAPASAMPGEPAMADDTLDAQIAALLKELGVSVSDPKRGLLMLARQAADTASRIRDRFAPDGWRTLTEIVDLALSAIADDDCDLVDLTSQVLTRLSGFTGLVRENMYQFTGWRFMQCGRRIERARMSATIAASLIAPIGADGEPAEGALEALLEFTDSRVTYRRRYSVDLSMETVLDLTILDPLNPRSLAFQVSSLADRLVELPGVRAGETRDTLQRRIARLKVRLETADAIEVDTAFLNRIVGDLGLFSELLTRRYLMAAPAEIQQAAVPE